MIPRLYPGQPAVIIATGPSLTVTVREQLRQARAAGKVRLWGMNNVYQDFPTLDGFIACDPKWWHTYGATFRAQHPTTPAWHWDREVAAAHGLEYIEGRWGDGLSTDPAYIHYGHSSGYQAIGLALHTGADPIILAGFDMDYPPDQPRHYFHGLSDVPGEYPVHLRKWSTFDGLLKCYDTIAAQVDRPQIINTTRGSKLRGFPYAPLEELLK